jgi:hypothetical protein
MFAADRAAADMQVSAVMAVDNDQVRRSRRIAGDGRAAASDADTEE